MIDGIEHGGINMSGVGHEGGDAGVVDKKRQRIEQAERIADLTRRVEALEKDQRESKLP